MGNHNDIFIIFYTNDIIHIRSFETSTYRAVHWKFVCLFYFCVLDNPAVMAYKEFAFNYPAAFYRLPNSA